MKTLDLEMVSALRGLMHGDHISGARAADVPTDFDDLTIQRRPSTDDLQRRALQSGAHLVLIEIR